MPSKEAIIAKPTDELRSSAPTAELAQPQPDQQAEPRGHSSREDRHFMHRTVLFDTVSLLFVAVAGIVWYAADVLMLVFACILFAILLFDISRRVRQWLHLPHWMALSLVVTLLLLVFAGAGWLMAPQVSQQAGELANTVPQALKNLQERMSQAPLMAQLMDGLPPPDQMAEKLASLLPRAGLFFSGLLGVVGNIAIIVFVGIYLAYQPGVYINGIVTLVPQRKRARVRQVFDELGRTLGQWLAGKAISMLVVGVVTTAGLVMLDIPLALVLGIIAGLLDFIPYVGPIMAGVPAVLIALTQDPLQAGYVALLFLAIQLAEGYLLMPLIEKRTVSLPPALTIATQVLLGALLGMAGVALATPLAAVAAVLITMLYVQDVLGDHVRTPSEKGK
ncbi:AI-2E family transporter [Noviherbaspirillum sp. CPCC 100848]|uniref:AI-2E family transporter n=1 Tax=Noviherbaspirillum album TaxID=3080276 RepID=A0ABU6JIL5_9BURK|nr:AI-2E family transporter [Noviherbaspirillum sp. CPCC 100848]MEC4723100.1 AI-2E family transporter [Noviherbaspirillum sp. CPCC 100848]